MALIGKTGRIITTIRLCLVEQEQDDGRMLSLPVNMLAMRRPNIKFLTTFADKNPTSNIKSPALSGTKKMREYIQRAGVYLATTKETFGIGTLEAMASGVLYLDLIMVERRR